MAKIEKIYRKIDSFESTGRTIRGLAVSVGTWSKDLGGFREMIAPEALTDDLILNSDVMLCVDHDPSKVLARSKYGKGSLNLRITPRGLEFETEAPQTTLGNDMLEMIKRQDYSQCSFCFTISGEEWKNEDDITYRTITKIDRLFDVSIVYDPAYDATSVDVRSNAVLSTLTKLNTLEREILSIYVG
jgi:hypothetical protein